MTPNVNDPVFAKQLAAARMIYGGSSVREAAHGIQVDPVIVDGWIKGNDAGWSHAVQAISSFEKNAGGVAEMNAKIRAAAGY